MKKSVLLVAVMGIFVLSSFTNNTDTAEKNTTTDDYCSITKSWSVNGEVVRSITISGSPCSEVNARIDAVQ